MLKPLWRRLAPGLAARLAPRVLAAVRAEVEDATASIQEELTRLRLRVDSLDAMPKVSTDLPGRREPMLSLPSSLALLELQRECGPAVTLVRSEPPGAYEAGLMAGSSWGTEDVLWLLRMLLAEGGSLLDVGANIGAISLPIAADGHPVVAVEMLPANALKLHLACLANGATNLRVVQAAASAVDGVLHYGGTEAWGAVGTGSSVAAAMRLDTIMEMVRLSMPDFMAEPLVVKLDVEGHEMEALRGAAGLIEGCRPAIVFESIEAADAGGSQVSKQCKRHLAALGYDLFLQRGRVLVPRGAGDLQEGAVADFLALPPHRRHVLDGAEVRALSPAERVAWLAEDALQQEAGHRLGACAAIEAIRQEGASYVTATDPLLEMLESDADERVAARARAARACE
ncbi:FkbM family methyltransferase [Belnapia rosea]|uniref:FkbM family methyltransferase n=1 Tax=Belnapia rosea TaxID=938405 RepID=UPI000881C774|nr:FkbM family methyltransferase [Belnapia rosea]SDB66212.1 methyltransferase, FkbM family [Belnapia rosea]